MTEIRDRNKLLSILEDRRFFQKVETDTMDTVFYKIKKTKYWIGINKEWRGNKFAFYELQNNEFATLWTCDFSEIFAVVSRDLRQQILFNIEQFEHYKNELEFYYIDYRAADYFN